MLVKKEFSSKILSLPHFKTYDAPQLISMARKRMGYKEEYPGGPQIGGGIRITTRLVAIAILLGPAELDSPKFQVPATKFIQ